MKRNLVANWKLIFTVDVINHIVVIEESDGQCEETFVARGDTRLSSMCA